MSMMPSCGSIFSLGNKNLKFTINSILPGDLAQEIERKEFVDESTQCNIQKQSGGVCNGAFMILDCRSFLAYNFKHICGAINVNCTTSMAKKRLQQGKISLVDLVTSEHGKERLRNGQWAKVVVYDESSSELENIPSSHPIKLVLSSLVDNGKEAFLLKGIYLIWLYIKCLNKVYIALAIYTHNCIQRIRSL